MDTYSIFGDPDPASFLNADLDSAAFCKNMMSIWNTASNAKIYIGNFNLII